MPRTPLPTLSVRPTSMEGPRGAGPANQAAIEGRACFGIAGNGGAPRNRVEHRSRHRDPVTAFDVEALDTAELLAERLNGYP